MRRISLPLLAMLAAAAPPPPGDSRAAPALTYADAADLALAAPVAAQVRIAEAEALKDEQAAGVPPGVARFYVAADMVSLIRAPQPLPARVAYLVDLPRDAKGKAAKLRKGTEFLILAAPVPGRPNELRLIAPDAQLPFTPAEAERLRAIVREAAGSAAPPRITGIGKAFHVPGAIPGESETQIFLQTADGRPVSLSVLRRPGQTPQWAVALSEIVDEAAAPPAPNTLLWYRLACTLPARLPAQSLGEADADGAAAIEADYRLVLERLGPCLRNRRAR
ncbi:MAG: hypothetical protein QOG84_2461 [Sphingomonadales bacterium]|jgi:hypothetical protein|nr:hypothetical protein [Sphingomonadales bacterium]